MPPPRGFQRMRADEPIGHPSCPGRPPFPHESRNRFDGAAPESNRPSVGLPHRTGFEDLLGHRAHAAPRLRLPAPPPIGSARAPPAPDRARGRRRAARRGVRGRCRARREGLQHRPLDESQPRGRCGGRWSSTRRSCSGFRVSADRSASCSRPSSPRQTSATTDDARMRTTSVTRAHQTSWHDTRSTTIGRPSSTRGPARSATTRGS